MKNRAEDIELVDVDLLIPNKDNMNMHSKAQIDRLVKLIEYQGFRNPIIAQKGTQLVVAGHGRLIAAKQMGLKEVPVIYQEFESKEQLYAYMVSDNAISEWAALDLESVANNVKEFEGFDVDKLGLIDFDMPDFGAIPESVEDEVQERGSDNESNPFSGQDELDEVEKTQGPQQSFILEVSLPSEDELLSLYNEILEKGYIAKMKR